MAKAKTTAELTIEVEYMKARITSQSDQLHAIWALLRSRMDGDGRVRKVVAKLLEQGAIAMPPDIVVEG